MVSQNGAAYVPLLTSVTLAQAYVVGTVAADQTLPLLDANGGGFTVDGPAAAGAASSPPPAGTRGARARTRT